jgi:hypothetical protein
MLNTAIPTSIATIETITSRQPKLSNAKAGVGQNPARPADTEDRNSCPQRESAFSLLMCPVRPNASFAATVLKLLYE